MKEGQCIVKVFPALLTPVSAKWAHLYRDVALLYNNNSAIERKSFFPSLALNFLNNRHRTANPGEIRKCHIPDLKTVTDIRSISDFLCKSQLLTAGISRFRYSVWLTGQCELGNRRSQLCLRQPSCFSPQVQLSTICCVVWKGKKIIWPFIHVRL